MPRKNFSKSSNKNSQKAPWYKQLWFVISATAVVVSAILLNGPAMLQNARILPKEVIETKRQFKSWVKEDECSGQVNPDTFLPLIEQNEPAALTRQNLFAQ